MFFTNSFSSFLVICPYHLEFLFHTFSAMFTIIPNTNNNLYHHKLPHHTFSAMSSISCLHSMTCRQILFHHSYYTSTLSQPSVLVFLCGMSTTTHLITSLIHVFINSPSPFLIVCPHPPELPLHTFSAIFTITSSLNNAPDQISAIST